MSVRQAALQRWQDLQYGLVVVDDNHCLADSSVSGLTDIPRTSTPCKSQAEVLMLPEALMMNPTAFCCWLEPQMTCVEDPDLPEVLPSDSAMQLQNADAAMWWPRIQEDFNQDVDLEFDLTDVVDPNLVLSLAEKPETSPPVQQRRRRHHLQAWQKDILRSHFQEDPYCIPVTRDLLASQLGITTKKVMGWFRNERSKYFGKPRRSPKTKTPRSGSKSKSKASGSPQTTLPSPPSSSHHGKRSRRKNINPQRATTPYEDTSVLEYNVRLVRDDAGVVPDVDSSLPYTQSWMNQTWRYHWTDQSTWQYEAFSVPRTLTDNAFTDTSCLIGHDALLPTIVHPASTYSGASSVTVSTITQPTYAVTLNRGAFGTHVTDSGCHVTRCSTI